MHFKRKFLSLLIAFLIAITAAGCGANADTSSQTTTASSVQASDMFTERDLSGDYDESDATRIELDDEDVTISEEGVYILSGTLEDGQIIVDAPEDAKIQIVLDGVTIINSNSAAIYVKQAKKVFITLADGSENTLSVTGDYVQTDDNTVDAVIFSKEDLTLNGTGSLTIKAEKGHGIVSKDDLVLTNGTYTITAEKKDLDANNSIRIADGTYTLTAGTDGLHVNDNEDENKGFVYILDGDLTISAGDDGIHAYSDLTIDGGEITVSQSYEGLEGTTVTINDGTIDVTSSDDGINAAGGSDSGSGGQNDPFASEDESALITINGGTVHVNANGDGIDSNGSLKITGGTTYVEGPTNGGNGILDVGDRSGTATITGGTFIGTGASGMEINFSDDSTQGAILQTVNTTTGTATLTDSSGKTIASLSSDKSYSCVIVSSPDIQQGSTYTLSAGGSNTSIQMSSLIIGESDSMGGGGQGGGQPQGGGQGGPGGQR